MALPSWQAEVLQTPMVARFTVEELKILETWVREHGLGWGKENSEALLWSWKGVPVTFTGMKIHLGPSGENGRMCEVHVGEGIWLKEQGRLQ